MTQKLVVIAGPANTGKMPLARKLAAGNPELKIVHRDDLRAMFRNHVDEGIITWAMGDLTRRLLKHGHTPLIVAWNLEEVDQLLWRSIASKARVPLEWLDVRRPEVAAMIPPMEPPPPVQHASGYVTLPEEVTNGLFVALDDIRAAVEFGHSRAVTKQAARCLASAVSRIDAIKGRVERAIETPSPQTRERRE